MAKSPTVPSILRARVPQVPADFHRLGEDLFEEICTHLFFYEPGLKNADRFNAPYQAQYGADVLAERIDGTGIEVISCKCYKSLAKGDIPTFTDEFLRHWSTYWAPKKVRRFILCIACDTRSKQRCAEIEREKARFQAIGVEFDVWGQRQLTHRVLAHPEVARTYFETFNPDAPAVAPVSTTPAASGLGGALYSAAAIQQINALQSALETEVVAQIDRSVMLAREGDIDRAKAMLETLRTDPVRWSSIGAATQARILRQQGVLALQGGDRTRCEELLSAAEQVSPASEPRLRAVLALYDSGIEAALQVLEKPSTKEGAFLRASLLLELPDLTAARKLLDEWLSLKGTDPEWHRIDFQSQGITVNCGHNAFARVAFFS